MNGFTAGSTRCATRLRDAGIRICRPEGGFYLFPDFSPLAASLADRGIASGNTLTDRLLQDTGVVLLPGSALGMHHTSQTGRLA